MRLIESIAAEAPSIQALRRDLHAHPELGFEEQRTSDLIASTLTGWGIPVHRGLGRTGVVGIVRNGSSARAVGLRADIDALPVTERNGIDPVPVAAQMVQAFQTIISRNKRPIDTGVLSVTMIRAGEAVNVVPDSCELQGTVRTFTVPVLDLIERRMREIAQATAQAFEASCEFTLRRNYPPTVNHTRETQFARDLLGGLV